MSPCIVKAWVASSKHFMSHTLIIHAELVLWYRPAYWHWLLGVK